MDDQTRLPNQESHTPRQGTTHQVGSNPPDLSPLSRPLPTNPPKLLDQLRQALRARHYSRRTENTYVAQPATRSGIPSRSTYWRQATTSAPFKNFSAIVMSRRR